MAGIYIHIPFCKQACHYCDFHFSTSLNKKEDMLNAIQTELELRAKEFKNESVSTIYFGGGTPSVLTINEIDNILKAVYAYYKVEPDPEITLEANPDDLTDSYLDDLAASAVNRLSIGVQSFFDEDLKLMNRAHNAEEARRVMKKASSLFSNISLDLIYGIPNLSDSRWNSNIETALSYNITHISSYALTVEPKTALHSFIQKGIIPEIDEEQAEAQFYHLIGKLEKEGFVHYELSNFGRPNFFSRNNTAYWQGKSYLGIGPSAHSYNGTQRSWNIANNARYIKSISDGKIPEEVETLSLRDRYNEYIMTGLRTMWGVSLREVKQRFGPKHYEYLMEYAQGHLADGLLVLEGDSLLVSKKGRFLSDGLAADLFMLPLEKKK